VEWDSLGAQVVGAGSHDGWLISWDNSTVGVGNQGTGSGQGTQVVGTGSHHSRLVGRDHSSVGVGNQVWDTSQGTSWAKGWQSGGNRADATNSWANGAEGMNSWGNGGWGEGGASHNWTGKTGTRSDSGVESGSLGTQMVSPGGHNRRGVSWGHGAVGVGNQMWDTSKGANIGTGSSDDGASLGKDGAGMGNDWGNWGGNGGSVEGWAYQAGSRGDSSVESSSFGGQVVGPGGDNGWLIGRGHGSIGVGHQLGDVDGSKGSGQNASAGNGSRAKGSQQLHVWFVL